MWLDEIEEYIESIKAKGDWAPVKLERMARVLRELAKIAKRAERCDTDGYELTCPFCAAQEGHDWTCSFAKLSDDAKELLG